MEAEGGNPSTATFQQYAIAYADLVAQVRISISLISRMNDAYMILRFLQVSLLTMRLLFRQVLPLLLSVSTHLKNKVVVRISLRHGKRAGEASTLISPFSFSVVQVP